MDTQTKYIERKLETKIQKYLRTPEILTIVGPRQSGKTTLLRHIYDSLKNAVFLTFEDQKVLTLFDNSLDEFIELYIKPYTYVFIDEFQYARTGGKSLKYIYDTQKVKLIISGSSSVDLTIKALKYLVGRIFIFSLFPLDFKEFLSYKNPNLLRMIKKFRYPLDKGKKSHKVTLHPVTLSLLNTFYEEYTVYGGYPRVVLAKTKEEKEEVLKNIYNTYFLRDIKDLLGLIDDHRLANLLKGLALQIGNMIQFQELSHLADLSFPTVKKYLNFLEKTYIALQVRPFFANKRSEIVKNPKMYFFDTGLRNYVVNDFRKVADRPDGGALLENAFFMECVKRDIFPKYWRTKTQEEIDFILPLTRNRLLAVEIKKCHSQQSQTSTRTAMKHFLEKYPEALFLLLYFENRVRFNVQERVKNDKKKDKKILSLPIATV